MKPSPSIDQKIKNLSPREREVFNQWIGLIDQYYSHSDCVFSKRKDSIFDELGKILGTQQSTIRGTFRSIYKKLSAGENWDESERKQQKLVDLYLSNKKKIDEHPLLNNKFISSTKEDTSHLALKYLTSEYWWNLLWEKASPNTLLFEPYKQIKRANIKSFFMNTGNIQEFPPGAKIRCRLNLEKSGYVVLICKFASAEIGFASPTNSFASVIYSQPGEWNCPSPDAPKSYFELDEQSGIDKWIGIISDKKIPLSWIPQDIEQLKTSNPKQLSSSELRELVDWTVSESCELTSGKYRIIPKPTEIT